MGVIRLISLNACVAPHIGAWIEIICESDSLIRRVQVAPHIGAWIEIMLGEELSQQAVVAPHAGA